MWKLLKLTLAFFFSANVRGEDIVIDEAIDSTIGQEEEVDGYETALLTLRPNP